MPENPTMTEQDRLSEIDRQIAALHAQLKPLTAERAELVTAQARREWPDGPFTLRYWQFYREMSDEYDTPLKAVGMARAMCDSGDGAPDTITDRHGTRIYDLAQYPPRPLVDGYPEVPDRG